MPAKHPKNAKKEEAKKGDVDSREATVSAEEAEAKPQAPPPSMVHSEGTVPSHRTDVHPLLVLALLGLSVILTAVGMAWLIVTARLDAVAIWEQVRRLWNP